MPRVNNISDLVAAEVAFRDEKEELHDDEPMRSHHEKGKRHKRDDDEIAQPPEEKINHAARFEELLEMVTADRKAFQAFIAAEAERHTKAGQRAEQKKQEREAKRAQREKDKADFWAKKQQEIHAMVSKGNAQAEKRALDKADEDIRKLVWRRLEY